MKKLMLYLTMLCSCGRVDVEDSKHEVQVEGETTHTVQVEFSHCDEIVHKAERTQCILDTIELLKELAKDEQ